MTTAEVAGQGAPARFREAYEAVLPELTALPDDELLRVNVDVLHAVATVLGCLPNIQALKAEAVRAAGVDVKAFEQLENYTLALAYANAQFVAASEPAQSLPILNEQGTKLRAQLVEDVEALAKRGLLDERRLGELKGPNGYGNLAHDLMALSALVRSNWDRVQGRTAVALAELDEADKLVDRLLRGIGERIQPSQRVAAERKARQRAFTLFYNAYDEVRRVVTFLRWKHEDVEKFAPTLYGKAKRRGEDEETDSDTTVDTDTADQLASAAHAWAGGAATGTSPTEDDNNIAPGMPGSSPYEN